MVYKALLVSADFFLISYIKRYKFYNRRWNLWTPKTMIERQFNCWLSLLTLSTLPICQVIFQWKQTKEKLGNKWLKYVKEFSRRFDFAKRKKEIRQINSMIQSHLRRRLFYDMKSNLCNAFILKCVLITNISIEHYMEGIIR